VAVVEVVAVVGEAVVAEMVVAGVIVDVEVEVVRPRVPEIVTAPRGIEVLSATRFHFLNVGRMKTGATVITSATSI